MPAMRLSLRSFEPRHFGTGWMSGVASAALGLLGLGAVACFHYPSLLTVPELRSVYPLPYVRALLHLVLVGAFTLGVVSIYLRQNKALGTAGITATLIAAVLGGSQVPVGEGAATDANAPYMGLDWFLLNMIVYSAVFIPLERLFAQRPAQSTFRAAWRTDLAYFFVSALFVQVATLLTMKPAMVLFQWAAYPELQAWVRERSLVAQFVAILVLTDLTQYWIHRAFHALPALWRFHQIHHSAESMDWLAGSRLHLVDVAVTRGLTYVPIYVLGFSEAPLFAYVAFVSVQATFIHANVRFKFGPLAWVVATPQFHHWHHGAEPEAIDKNFAVHLPVIDWLFGTFHLPKGRWPASYGLAHGEPIPEGYVRQFAYPFKSAPLAASDEPPHADRR
jgi:sterol desaturase/sphingolipid hydroxylase (fatty acid hydroxylase superfamily)